MKGRKLEQAAIAKMREMRAAGRTIKSIAVELGCSASIVSRHTADMPDVRTRAKEPARRRSPKDEELRARWREIQASAQSALRAKREHENEAPARSCTSDRRTAPNEAALQLPPV